MLVLRDFSRRPPMFPLEHSMNLTRLQTFVEVVRHGTLAGAADALSFTPSAVSQQMAKLETEIGTPLLARDAGRVGLTEAGRLLHDHALGILGAVREARDELEALQAQQVKRLRIGACPLAAGAVLPRALRLLRRRLPRADLALEEAAPAAVERAVREGRLQVGVWVAVPPGGTAAPAGHRSSAATTRPAAAGDEALPAGREAEVIEVVLRHTPMLVALAADHPLARRRELVADDLAGSPEAAHLHVESVRTLVALVAAGEGYALVPDLAADPLPAGVVLRPLVGAPEWELRAARPARDVLSVGTLAVLDALRNAAAHRETRGSGAHAHYAA
jgi:DNA-binding transcriptional LysR family regulator